MKEKKQLKPPQNPKRLPTCKHKVEKNKPKTNKKTHYKSIMVSSAPLLPYSLELDAPTPPHKQPDSSVQTDMSVVSSDHAPEPLPSPLPLSSLLLTHWPATCSLFLLPITRSSVLCASCYMSMSLVIKNAL